MTDLERKQLQEEIDSYCKTQPPYSCDKCELKRICDDAMNSDEGSEDFLPDDCLERAREVLSSIAISEDERKRMAEKLEDYCDKQFLCVTCQVKQQCDAMYADDCIYWPDGILKEAYDTVFPSEFITAPSVVIHPAHYNQGSIECWDAMESAFGKEDLATFCVLNAFKYIFRHKEKGNLDDIKKAINYLEKYVEIREGVNES